MKQGSDNAPQFEVRGTAGKWRLIDVATGEVLRRSQYRNDLLRPGAVLIEEDDGWTK